MSVFYTKKDQKMLDELWANALKNIDKTATESVNINERITQIINNKSQKKFSSVQEKVQEMLKRSGYEDFNKQKKISTASSPEQPQQQQGVIQILKIVPEMSSTIKNICESSKGLLPIISIIGKLKDLYNSQVVDSQMWSDHKFLQFIATTNLSCKARQPEYSSNIGKIDTSRYNDPTSQDVFAETVSKSN